ncbi:MAG: RloB domain-containing protein [Gammaproteobacteria bacterium]|nr:RloB domain-containing protein [Gammaproteobacteria bacterium]
MAKRKPKPQYSPKRMNTRESYDRVLIVCEGSKTEINYFNGLIDHLKLSTVNIRILDIRQTTPDSLFRKAKELYQDAKRKGNSYDKVYCIFDKDSHARYKETKDNIEQTSNFYVAFSEPCFEYWLLLHYENTTKPFTCFDQLRHDKLFKKNFSNYEKNEQNIFAILKEQLPTACQNAKDNPHTNVNELVEYLQKIK